MVASAPPVGWREREREKKERHPSAPLFTEGSRTEVARGGAPTVGGPRAESKLMDKGRQPRNFRRINRAVLLCVTEVLPGVSSLPLADARFILAGERIHAGEKWEGRDRFLSAGEIRVA